MSFPAYEKYKDSGVEWLGEVPEHWRMKPLWTHFRRVKRTGFADEELLSVYRDYGVIPKASRDDNFNNPSDDLGSYQLVEQGDLVLNKMKAWQGSVAISEFRGIVSPAYFVYTATHSGDSKFLHYLMRCQHYTTGYLSLSKGIRVNQWDIDPQYHSRMPLLLPQVQEQRAIAAFLDHETAKIDALVAEQERLIALLAEKRQAIISHAVTKGLNPDAPMKDSGIEWLGEVPEHWAVAALSYRYEVALGKMLDEKRITGEHLAPYLRNADVQWGYIRTDDLPEMDFENADIERYSLKPGDLLVCEGGDVGRAAIWRGELRVCYYQKALHRLRPTCAVSDAVDFLYYALYGSAKSGRFTAMEGKSTIAHLTAEALRRYHFTFPPLEEQQAIAAYLNSETSRLDALTKEAVRGIELLKERRAALISAAVTGKIDVRGLANVGTGQEQI